jgi:hypothetical protein
VKRVIGVLHQMQRRHVAQLPCEGLEEREIGEFIACSLQEQHGNFDVAEMLAAFVGRFSGSVQRKSKKEQSAHAGQRGACLRLRSHPTAK